MKNVIKFSILPLCMSAAIAPCFCSCGIKYFTWKYSDAAFKTTIQPHEHVLYNSPDAAYEAYIKDVSNNKMILVEDRLNYFSSLFYPQSTSNNDETNTFIKFGIKKIDTTNKTLSFKLTMQYDNPWLGSKYVSEIWTCDNVAFSFTPDAQKPTLSVDKNIYLKDDTFKWKIKYILERDGKKENYWTVESTDDIITKSKHWQEVGHLMFRSYYFQNVEITFPSNK